VRKLRDDSLIRSLLHFVDALRTAVASFCS
jgi:hypothetical protein